MKIKDIRTKRIPIPLTRPYTIAYKTTSAVEICVVEVELSSGQTGLGSANPSPYVVGESLDDTMKMLSEENLQQFIGKDIRELRKLCQDLMQLFSQHPGARAAMDIAFHDAFGKALGIPLIQYLGRYHHSLATSITIGIKNVADTLEEAQEYVDRKFKIIKVKLGHSVDEDIERLSKLRERFGMELGIRVDANQGYSYKDLLHYYAQTKELNIELVEQPLPSKEIDPMRELPSEIKTLIAADESLVNAHDAMKLVEGQAACGIFNIKLMKSGGIFQAQRIAEVASLGNCDLMWGCNDESIISISAALQVAFSCPHTRYIDLDGSLDLATDVVSGGFMIEDGLMSIVEGPGLGLQHLS